MCWTPGMLCNVSVSSLTPPCRVPPRSGQAKPLRRWEDLPEDEAVLTEFAELWVVFGEAFHARARSGPRR